MASRLGGKLNYSCHQCCQFGTIEKNDSPANDDYISYSQVDDNVWADVNIDEGGDDIAPRNTIIADAVENSCKTKTVKTAMSPSEAEELPNVLPPPDFTYQKRALMRDEAGGDIDYATPQKDEEHGIRLLLFH